MVSPYKWIEAFVVLGRAVLESSSTTDLDVQLRCNEVNVAYVVNDGILLPQVTGTCVIHVVVVSR